MNVKYKPSAGFSWMAAALVMAQKEPINAKAILDAEERKLSDRKQRGDEFSELCSWFAEDLLDLRLRT